MIQGIQAESTSRYGKSIAGKKILVTGGTGSFGKIFVRQLLKYNPAEIVVLSRSEDHQGMMKSEYVSETRIGFILGDICDYWTVRNAMRGINLVIHAAALKWIPEVENNAWEGIRVNVLGTKNIITAALEEQVEKVVALSTDKAVEPVNTYGITKALQEKLIISANLEREKRTVFISTRYGNVIGSRGSVVPMFISQLNSYGCINVTNPSMSRFMMTLDESVDLVLAAVEYGVGGEIFTRVMPGFLIGDLADVVIQAYPKKAKIKVTGARPGEKLHEVIIAKHESIRTVKQDENFIILPQIRIPQIERKYSQCKRLTEMNYTSDIAPRLSKEELQIILIQQGLIPIKIK